MPWTVGFLEDDRVVSVTTSGIMNLVLIKQVATEAHAIATEHGTGKYLADDRQMVPDLSTLEIYELPAELERLGLKKSDKVAVVYAEDSPKADDFKFFNDVAQNQLFTIQIFTRVEEAAEWLTSK